jgi:hypothetical protein
MIYLGHAADLETLLFVAHLVNSYRIDPKLSYLSFLSNIFQSGLTVLRNQEDISLAIDRLGAMRRTPDIGQCLISAFGNVVHFSQSILDGAIDLLSG